MGSVAPTGGWADKAEKVLTEENRREKTEVDVLVQWESVAHAWYLRGRHEGTVAGCKKKLTTGMIGRLID